MFKKVLICCFIILSLLFNIMILPAYTENSKVESNSSTEENAVKADNIFNFKAKSYTLVDTLSGNILLEYNSHEKLPIASVTKVMSMVLIMEAIDSGKLLFEDSVPVTESAFRMGGSQVYLKPGEEFTVDEMLKAVAIHSANDATVALAEKIAGSEEAFVNLMNAKAKDLGMNDTNFIDCTGLTDEGHYSSAHDIAVMSRELILKHPKILEYTSIWHTTFRDGKFSLDNTNKLIRSYQGVVNGLKTGFTSKAGYCLSASAKRNNLQLVSVVLGEPDSNTRFAESKKLLDYGFANYETAKVNDKGEEVKELEVRKGLRTKINAVYGDDVVLLLRKGDIDKVEREITLQSDITAPIEKGQKIGEITYKIDGNTVGKADVVTDGDVQRASFIKLFLRMVGDWFSLGRK